MRVIPKSRALVHCNQDARLQWRGPACPRAEFQCHAGLRRSIGPTTPPSQPGGPSVRNCCNRRARAQNTKCQHRGRGALAPPVPARRSARTRAIIADNCTENLRALLCNHKLLPARSANRQHHRRRRPPPPGTPGQEWGEPHKASLPKGMKTDVLNTGVYANKATMGRSRI